MAVDRVAELREDLRRAKATVASWPAWKREDAAVCFGCPMCKAGIQHRACPETY